MLPFVFATSPDGLGPEPVVFVDGSPEGDAAAARPQDVHLSHWPGNRTPAALKRDLSTEIAFAFVDADEAERKRIVGDARAFCLNHYDTDGVCALFVLRRPDEARRSRELLHDVARAGDLFMAPSEHAVAIDAALQNLRDPERSEVGRELADLEGDARFGALVNRALDLLATLLVDATAHPELWEAELERYRDDRARLAAAAFDDLIYLDTGVWTARVEAGETFDPGRHTFLGDGRLDRALLLGASDSGTTARFVIGTRSFFDLVSKPGSPRPRLAPLVEALNAAETAKGGEAHWRMQPQDSPSPEVWFGAAGLPFFGERAGAWLEPSRLDPVTIKGFFLDAVRETWPVPDDDDEAEEGEDIFAV